MGCSIKFLNVNQGLILSRLCSALKIFQLKQKNFCTDFLILLTGTDSQKFSIEAQHEKSRNFLKTENLAKKVEISPLIGFNPGHFPIVIKV